MANVKYTYNRIYSGCFAYTAPNGIFYAKKGEPGVQLETCDYHSLNPSYPTAPVPGYEQTVIETMDEFRKVIAQIRRKFARRTT